MLDSENPISDLESTCPINSIRAAGSKSPSLSSGYLLVADTYDFPSPEVMSATSDSFVFCTFQANIPSKVTLRGDSFVAGSSELPLCAHCIVAIENNPRSELEPLQCFDCFAAERRADSPLWVDCVVADTYESNPSPAPFRKEVSHSPMSCPFTMKNALEATY